MCAGRSWAVLGRLLVVAVILPLLDAGVFGQTPSPPVITSISVSNGQKKITFTPYPAAEEFRVHSTDSLLSPFAAEASGNVAGYEWSAPLGGPLGFYKIEAVPLAGDALLTSIVLNRLAYGPTPDELERILTGPNPIGPEAYIEEQLAPELIDDEIDAEEHSTNWVHVTATGTATGINFMMYLSGAGSVYIDDLKLVEGPDPDGGPNLLLNGDFEAPLSPPWLIHSNYAGSRIATEIAHSGNSCLQMVALAAGSTSADSFYQPFAVTTPPSSRLYTLSYWYFPSPDNRTLTARLTGNRTTASHSIRPPVTPGTLYAGLTAGTAELADLRAWHFLHAIRGKRQLMEVLAQFFDNHFNTQYEKSRQWFSDRFGGLSGAARAQLATEFEFRDARQWREVLMNPHGTFYDLLQISAESPAMTVYLDAVLSTKTNPNENYPRELVELFAMGADNGYHQGDIEEISKAWTGYRVVKKAPEFANDPFAPAVGSYTNDAGVWVMHFATASHHTGTKRIFTNNVVDARFGLPYAGRDYSLILTNGSGTNGYQDAWQIIRHVADLPYTQEFISVKLCQLFVHENFEYGVYDYTAPDLAPEAQLIKDCMTAWRTPASDGRQGNLRAILRVIFNSPLFRAHAASHQKLKTPVEFAVSAIRALRSEVEPDLFTADSDGYDLHTPLTRMGEMKLFDREEPDGYAEAGRPWLNTANFGERLRFLQHLLMAPGNSLKTRDYGSSGSQNVADPVRLLKNKLPAGTWNDAGAVVDYFLGILYPGEGRGNLTWDRAAAIQFLDTNEAGTPDPFAALSNASVAYDNRIRGMVSLLMTFPRFQEQ